MIFIGAKDRAILREMVTSDFKVRYQGSALGYVWSLLRPLFIFAILFVVFTYIIPIGKSIPHYAVQLFAGIVLWNFFSEATTIGLGSIVGASNLIRKVSVPRYLIVLASLVSALINFLLNLVVLFVFIVFDGVGFNWNMLLLPLIVIELSLFSLAISFVLSTACVKFRDIKYVWELVLQAGFYATPIIYMLSRVPENLHQIIFINPIAQMIQDTRWMIIGGDTVRFWDISSMPVQFLYVLGIILLLLVSVWYFNFKSGTFAEDI